MVIIFDKDTKTIQWGKDSLFNKWFRENWACKRTKLDPYLQPYLKEKNNSVDQRPNRKNWNYKKTVGNLHDIRFGSDFLDMTLRAEATKEKNK